MIKTTNILSEVSAYYSKKIAAHGTSPQGVDWNGLESQELRFTQLSKIFELENFSVNDLGCGYGALVDFLERQKYRFDYIGIDISEKMIQAAHQRYRSKPAVRFLINDRPDKTADYSVASGILNVRQNQPDTAWYSYIIDTLDILHETSREGFSFNCLTSYSDEHKKRPHLYYADPCAIFDCCKKRYSRNIALLHDYELFEFTILVRK